MSLNKAMERFLAWECHPQFIFGEDHFGWNTENGWGVGQGCKWVSNEVTAVV